MKIDPVENWPVSHISTFNIDPGVLFLKLKIETKSRENTQGHFSTGLNIFSISDDLCPLKDDLVEN